MQLPFYFAKRYLFAKKSRLVNLISGISILGIVIGTAALIIVLSVFNGLDGLVRSMYNSFDPDLKIEIVNGKTFEINEDNLAKIRTIDGVENVSLTLEENALARFNEKQQIVTLKGVDEHYADINSIAKSIYSGEFLLEDSLFDYAVIGYGIYAALGAYPFDYQSPFGIYVPKKGKYLSANPDESFNVEYPVVSGIFTGIADYEQKYVLVSLPLIQDLTEDYDRISAAEIGLEKNVNEGKIQKEIQNIFGENFTVKNRDQQNEFLYKTMKSERFGIILILSFILLISTFTMLAALLVLIYEKRKDIKVLQSLGATQKLIRRIFLFQGLLISLFGGIFGLLFGALIVGLQQIFGIVRLGDASAGFIVEAYPVMLKTSDFFLVLAIVLMIGLISGLVPLRYTSTSSKK